MSLDKLEGYIWFNGEFIKATDTQVPLLSHALHYGTGVFEGCRAYNGKVFKLKEHNERLINSGNLVDVPLPYSQEELYEAVYKTLEKNNLKDAYVRPIAWRGCKSLSVASSANDVNVAIAVWEWPSYYSGDVLEKGIKLAKTKWVKPDPRSVPVESKTCGFYFVGGIVKNQCERDGFNDALMLDVKGNIAECTSSNVFFANSNNKEIHTPAPYSLLNGITRQTVIELANKRGYKVNEREIKEAEFEIFDEAFVTGTAAEVTPVGQIWGKDYKVGEITKQLREDYINLVNEIEE